MYVLEKTDELPLIWKDGDLTVNVAKLPLIDTDGVPPVKYGPYVLLVI